MSAELIPSSTVDQIVAWRDAAIKAYAGAYEALAEAHKQMTAAHALVESACGSKGDTYESFVDSQRPEIQAFRAALGPLPNEHDFAEAARRVTDTQVWASLIERTSLDALMDQQAREELRAQMGGFQSRRGGYSSLARGDEPSDDLPHVTVENVQSTIRGFASQAGLIFRRGLANAFSKLDRRFRSHDGFKIGSRVVLTYMFNEWGDLSYHTHRHDVLQDIERVFLVLDGKDARATYAGIVGTIRADRREGHGRRQSEHEGDYFRVRAFKNGNAHLWFTRPDLVEKANKLLAEYYGDALGEGKDAPEDPTAPLENRAVGHARNLGWFPTPPKVVERVIDQADWRGCVVLEPSAGEGALAFGVIRAGAECVQCVELNPDRAAKIIRLSKTRGYLVDTHLRDFLSMPLEPIFDRVVMNPPFDRGRDVDHVWHAWKFLKPGGRLVAVMSASTEFREDKKTVAFREAMNAAGARWVDLPAGSFAPATYVNTLILAVSKPEE